MTNLPPPPKVEAIKHPVLKSVAATLLIALGLGALAYEREREKELAAGKRANPHWLVDQVRHDNYDPHPTGSILHWTQLAKQFQANPNDAKLEQQLADDVLARAISQITTANPNVDQSAVDAAKRVIGTTMLIEMKTIDKNRDLLGDHKAIKGDQTSQDKDKPARLKVEDQLAANEKLVLDQIVAVAPQLKEAVPKTASKASSTPAPGK